MSRQGLDADTIVKQGLALLGQGQFVGAERAARSVLAVLPDRADALNVLGIALSGLERHGEAIRVFTELSKRQPKFAGHWTNLGTALRSLRRWDEALHAYQRAASLGERSPDFLLNLGLLQIERGDQESARAVLREAHRLAPRDGEIAFHYADTCYELSRVVEGAKALADWQALEIHTTEGLVKIASLLMKLGDAQSGQLALDRALAEPRPDPATRMQFVYALERTNRLAEARAQLDALLADPRATALDGEEVQAADAKLMQREGRNDEAARSYRDLADRQAAEHRHFFLYPLAKTLDAAGRYDEAFAALDEAHRSQSIELDRLGPHDGTGERIFHVPNRGADPQDVAQWDASGAPPAAASPIFIVAFPRSGTTLLEQALAAHPQVVTMDEQPFIHLTLDKLSSETARYPERMASLTTAELDAARSHYWSLVASRVQLGQGQRLLDKNPLKMLRLPAICRLFPNSPILLAIRHPCDVILSCYMQSFRGEFAWACRDLPTLADAYDRSFRYWYGEVEVLKPRVREVIYEEFVVDFESSMRDIAEFVGLPWDDALLEPTRHAKDRGFISTPSYSQVVQPVNTRAVGRWQHYRRHLEPILPVLKPQLERWNYQV
jgi:tetratricopeptide (TPR) repeat protein